MFEDKFETIELIDTYGMLLTETKKEILNDYYLLDISLGEIAEQRNISRQAVHDSITKSITKLTNFEKELKIIKKQKLIKNCIQSLIIDNKITKEEYEKLLNILEE